MVFVPCLSVNIDLPLAVALKKIFSALESSFVKDPDFGPPRNSTYGLSISLPTGTF